MSVSVPFAASTAQVTGDPTSGAHVISPRLASVPSPVFETSTVCNVGVVTDDPFTAVNATLVALTERIGCRSVKFTVTSCGLFAAPVAETGTLTAAGLTVSPVGFTPNVSVVPFETAHESHDAGFGGQLTVPSEPPPLFPTVTVCPAGAPLPRMAWKTSVCCESAIRGMAETASVTAMVLDTLSLGAATTTGKTCVPGARFAGSTDSVRAPVPWFTAQPTRVFAGVAAHVMVPRFARVPAPVFDTVTVAVAGVVPPEGPSDAVKLTVDVLSVRTGWSMIRLTWTVCGLAVWPTALICTDAAVGDAANPVGFAVNVTAFPFATSHDSHAVGLAGQLTGPNRPSPPFATVMVFVSDCVVPRTKLTEVLVGVYAIAERHGLIVTNVFHAGDGNLHPLFSFDRTVPGTLERVLEASDEVVRLCVGAGGALSGEHGIGLEKRDFMPLMFSEDDLAAQACVRAAFDPEGIMNPSKVLPDGARCGDFAIARAGTDDAAEAAANLPEGSWL